MRRRAGAHPARGPSEDLVSQISSCPNLLGGLFKQESPECWPAVLTVTGPLLCLSSISLNPQMRETGVQRVTMHFLRASAVCSTPMASHWVGHPGHLGQDCLHGDATSHSLQNVSHPCPMAPSHSLSRRFPSPLDAGGNTPNSLLIRKQKCSHEWPNAHVPRYRRHFLTL